MRTRTITHLRDNTQGAISGNVDTAGKIVEHRLNQRASCERKAGRPERKRRRGRSVLFSLTIDSKSSAQTRTGHDVASVRPSPRTNAKREPCPESLTHYTAFLCFSPRKYVSGWKVTDVTVHEHQTLSTSLRVSPPGFAEAGSSSAAVILLLAAHGALLYVFQHLALSTTLVSVIVVLIVIKHLGLLARLPAYLRRRFGK